jgi:hypothetical protein
MPEAVRLLSHSVRIESVIDDAHCKACCHLILELWRNSNNLSNASHECVLAAGDLSGHLKNQFEKFTPRRLDRQFTLDEQARLADVLYGAPAKIGLAM